MNMRSKLILLGVFAIMLAVPASSTASWGKKKDNGEACKQANPYHCYAYSSWVMGGSERVEGMSGYQETKIMNVPEWGTGAFVTNENWLSFTSKPTYWAEVGQIAGGNGFVIYPEGEHFARDCCSLHSFWGYQNGAGFTDYAAPWTVGGAEWHLYQISGQNHNGTWCEYFGATQAWCESGLPSWGTILNTGSEFAAESEPENYGRTAVNAWWANTTHNWRFATIYFDSKLCAKPNSSPAYAGNIEYGTCP